MKMASMTEKEKQKKEQSALKAKYREGYRAGKDAGMEKGFYLGKILGSFEGGRERACAIAQRLKEMGFDAKFISEVTRIDLDQIS